VSGKIDRACLPNLSHLLTNAGPEADDAADNSLAVTPGSADPGVGVDPNCEEVLAICRAVFETPLGWDDVFADNGGHSIVIARLAQRLQAEGWVVTVRALLSDCDTARKVANHPRQLQPASENPTPAMKTGRHSTERDEAAARVLSPGYFTTLQVLFLSLLYSPPLAGFLGFVAFAAIGEFS
jgi:hypothetical protein